MPHLQFEFNGTLNEENKKQFACEIRALFAEIMDTGTEHIVISIREYDRYSLSIGRANPDEMVCLMDLDIRVGRTIEQRRALALKYMETVTKYFGVNGKNQYITFTQHPGEDFHLAEKFLADWETDEDPLADIL